MRQTRGHISRSLSPADSGQCEIRFGTFRMSVNPFSDHTVWLCHKETLNTQPVWRQTDLSSTKQDSVWRNAGYACQAVSGICILRYMPAYPRVMYNDCMIAHSRCWPFFLALYNVVMMSVWCHSSSPLPVERHTSCDVMFKNQFLTQSDTLRPFLVHCSVFETTFIPFWRKLHQLYKYLDKQMGNVNIYYGPLFALIRVSSVQFKMVSMRSENSICAPQKLPSPLSSYPARSHKITVFNRFLSTFFDSRRHSLLYRMDSRRRESTKKDCMNNWSEEIIKRVRCYGLRLF